MKILLYVILLLFITPCFGGQTIIVNEHGTILGGGGNTNKCNFVEIDGKVVNWKSRSFPIPIAISKDISNRRTQIIRQAIKIWNDSYHQYLKTYISDHKDKKYPYNLLKYDPIDPEDLYTHWFWYIFPLSAPFAILDRMLFFPYEGMGVIEQLDGYFEDLRGNGRTIHKTYGSGYIDAAKIIIVHKPLPPHQWHDSLSNPYLLSSIDFLTVALHELGHIIGLAHDKKKNALMHTVLLPGHRHFPKKRDMDYIFCQYNKHWNHKVYYLRGGSIEP